MARPDPASRQQPRLRSVFRVLGPVLIGVGLIMTAVAFASFFGSLGSNSAGLPSNFWMGFVGLPLMVIGGAITLFAYLGPATRYVAGEVTPVLRDSLGALGVGSAEQTCASCGSRNDANAQFCDSCGRPLATG